jgi:hypothetical protein
MGVKNIEKELVIYYIAIKVGERGVRGKGVWV